MTVIERNQWGPKPLAVRVDAYGNPREARRLDVGPPPGEGEVEFVPADQLQGAVARIAELEAEIERRRGDYIAGHVDGYRAGSTSSLANPGAVGA